ncbi:MAG: hypothetical protein P8N76_22840 [Pirellulaceae bacterium]|nr:hypothetical protein [Pirellulaceae bacterium]
MKTEPNDNRLRRYLLLISGLWLVPAFTTIAAPLLQANTPIAETTKIEPVESDMHEFMEYFFQPTYKRLKAAMANEPNDKTGWKEVKSNALILAEGSNLLLTRAPSADDAADWNNHSVQVQTFGSQLYKAAKAKDYATANRSYRAMIKNCNACHRQFENGKHILKP